MSTLLALLLILAAPESVSGQRALETVKILASDAFKGRKSGLESGQVAERWMAQQVEAIGLDPVPGGDDYFHSLKASVTEELPGADLRIGTKPCKYLDDYVTLLYSGAGKVSDAEVVWVGYGIHAPDHGRDDYAGINVEGKIVMAVRGKPEGSPFEEQRMIGYKSAAAADRGAIGFLLVEGDEARPGTIQEKYYRPKLPAIWLAGKTADAILKQAKLPNLETRIANDPGTTILPNVKISLTINARMLKDQELRNVVAVWSAKPDGVHKEEYVVLGAHLDHLGVDAVGNVYNGADDNASGSAMLLEVARAIATTGTHFERNIMFVWFAGEEQGLIGSSAFVKSPPIALDKIALMINVDMCGQGKPTIGVGGADAFPNEAHWLFDLEPPDFKVRKHRAGGGSDHWPFAQAAVPAFFMHTTGPHPNYHRPADDWEAIKPELLEVSGKYMRTLAEQAASAKRPFCRPSRTGEFLWNNAKVVDFGSNIPHIPERGVDIQIKWIEGGADNVFTVLDHELTQAEQKPTPHTIYHHQDERRLEAHLRSLNPTVLLGLRGSAATMLYRPAARLGVTLLAPTEEPTRDFYSFAKQKGLIVDLQKTPEPLVLDDHGPILLNLFLATKYKEQLKPKAPWLVVYRLNPLTENKSNVHAEVATEILHYRKQFGPRHFLVAPGNLADPTYTAQAPTLHPGVAQALKDKGLDARQISQLLGGNLIRMIEKARPTPKKRDAR